MELDIDRPNEPVSTRDDIVVCDVDGERMDFSYDVKFLGGVVEGFYGTPWTYSQRLNLFQTMSRSQLNSYIYAPKDDQKHRKRWKDLYDETESNCLSKLIENANRQGINFIYSISPGLDITYSSAADREALKVKLEQVAKLGATGFGIFFDDIGEGLIDKDAEIYESFAHAQVDITNYLFSALGRPKVFMLCPTEYCTSRAKPCLSRSPYLRTIGEMLDINIMVAWTGSRVISRSISVDHIKQVVKILRRPPIIWDNLHANDYDRRQVFLGPYDGRCLSIYPHIQGIFINPNTQYELNYIPILSFSLWVSAARHKYPAQDRNFQNTSLTSIRLYDPDTAFEDCCHCWLDEINQIPQVSSEQDLSINKSLNISQSFDESDSDYSYTNGHEQLDGVLITFEELHTVCSFLYLPGQLGKLSKDLLSEFYYIKSASNHFWQYQMNSRFLNNPNIINRRLDFKRKCDKIIMSITQFKKSRNLILCSLLKPYLDEIKDSIVMMKSYVGFIERREKSLTTDDYFAESESRINRSRFSSEVEKLLPSFYQYDCSFDNAVQPPYFIVRLPSSHDRERLETVCYGHLTNKFGIWDDLRPSKMLSNLRYLESFFRSDYEMHVIEDSDNLCGYMLHTISSDPKQEEQIQTEYNAFVLNNPDVSDGSNDQYLAFPTINREIIHDFPMKIFFCFQLGFKMASILKTLVNILMEKSTTHKTRGMHIVIDKFELVDTKLLKNLGFYLHPNGTMTNSKYYVLERTELE